MRERTPQKDMASRNMEMATQKTPHEAAALIQARVRGQQQRSRQSRAVKAVTRLQARQRGRYTRREYQKLLEFYNEQESFLAESKRRQLRLWHREQELYFLQHTTAEELDRIRQFQYEKSARRIQREWKRLHPTPLEDVDVSGLGRPFDPFGLIDESGSLASAREITDRKTLKTELFGQLPDKVLVTQEAEKLARRRAEIQDKLQRRRKDLDKQRKEKLPGNTNRRELFHTLVELRQNTARRLEETNEKFRKSRPERDLDAAQLSASCRNRLAFLQDDTRIQTLLNTGKRPASQEQIARECRRFEDDTATWSESRKREAWENHTRVLQSVLGKTHWYETFIAGEKQDIRRVYAASPWENERQVWQWPTHSKAKGKSSADATGSSVRVTAMDRFMFGLEGDGADENSSHNQTDEDAHGRPEPMDDQLASSWWRAHATQSHFSYTRQQQKQQRLERHRITGSNHAMEDAQVTPEMLVNPRFYELYKQSISKSRQEELERGVDARVSRLQRQIQQKVVEIETQIDVNTRVIIEKANLLKQQEARKTKEETASITIQRTVRGKLGRKRAQEHLAQYFVVVRGRAIRKGRCEECGESQAVLQCKQCEESLHFCPVCWVQVHSTRRRKTHVPIPMAVEVPTHDSKPMKQKKSSGLTVETFLTADAGTASRVGPIIGDSSRGTSTTIDAHQEMLLSDAQTEPPAGKMARTKIASSEGHIAVKPHAPPGGRDLKAPVATVQTVDAAPPRSDVEKKPTATASVRESATVDVAPVKRAAAAKTKQHEEEVVSTDDGVSNATIIVAEPSTRTSKRDAQGGDGNRPRPLAAAKAAISDDTIDNSDDANAASELRTPESDAVGTLATIRAMSASEPLASSPDDEMKSYAPTQAPDASVTSHAVVLEDVITRPASENAVVEAGCEPQKKKTTPQLRGRVAQTGGEAGAAPRPSLRERMAKGQTKPKIDDVFEVVTKTDLKPTEQPAEDKHDKPSPSGMREGKGD